MSKKKTDKDKTNKKGRDNLFIKYPPKSKKINNQNVLDEDYPIFCFKYLDDVSIKKCKDHKFFYDFLMRLQKLSKLGWSEIRQSHRHAYGLESIPKEKIKATLPTCITPEVKDLHVFRANGNNLPLIGIQIQNVFRILFIEATFGDIYKHD
ncbi:hypothetical protein EZS27_033615 [termite gut metagenome]|uniref:Uncharacterized protein n=1 Tax=termite gut metagenome TaxID=433724 RepID=A0A5J4Q2L5_9ZZZZ